jgi:hypothetical protein
MNKLLKIQFIPKSTVTPDVMAPVVITRGDDIIWTSGVVFGKGEFGFMQPFLHFTNLMISSLDYD